MKGKLLAGLIAVACGSSYAGESLEADVSPFASIPSVAEYEQIGEADSAEGLRHRRVSKLVNLPVVTAGPPWPPADLADENGNFILVGNLLREVSPGEYWFLRNRSVIVSKNTVPPLDAQGIENPNDWTGGSHEVLRELDLSPGSPDLDIELYTVSYGPHDDGLTGVPRVPAAGDSPYNLNKVPTPCADAFPVGPQNTEYFRPQYKLNEVPVLGFQGDNVAYDPATGEPYDPMTATDDAACAGQGCPGEDPVDSRRRGPVTLGEWLDAEGRVLIRLTQKNENNEYTHASFRLWLKDMQPNAVYTVWSIRSRIVPVDGVFEARDISPITVPNVITTDARGQGYANFEVPNPFPDPATDTYGMRMTGLSVVYHSDHMNWGACVSRFGSGVDSHAHLSTIAIGPDAPVTQGFDFTDFITVAP
ncbi:MAG: hypothetical protein Tsb002_08700 [Wenzhouxiangellaceae bacterium]